MGSCRARMWAGRAAGSERGLDAFGSMRGFGDRMAIETGRCATECGASSGNYTRRPLRLSCRVSNQELQTIDFYEQFPA